MLNTRFVESKKIFTASCECVTSLNGAGIKPHSIGALIFNSMNVIGLTRGKFAFIDDEDLDKVKNHKWYALKSGNNFYAATRPHILMHQLIMGKQPKGLEIDHKNHNGLDNRKHNLRIGTHSKNILNSKSHYRFGMGGTKQFYHYNTDRPIGEGVAKSKAGGLYGVHFFGRGKKRWCARIRYLGKQKTLGYYLTPQEANEAVLNFKRKHLSIIIYNPNKQNY